MDDLQELYQQVIFDHYRKPRNYGPLSHANRQAQGFNPLCGDKVTVYLDVENGAIHDLSFEGAGCAICTASASLMTEALKGRTPEEAGQLMQDFHAMVTGQESAEATHASLGKLEVLAGVREFPQRVKCATLAWHTMKAALENVAQPVSTE